VLVECEKLLVDCESDKVDSSAFGGTQHSEGEAAQTQSEELQGAKPFEGQLATLVGMDAVGQTMETIKARESAPPLQTETNSLTTSNKMSEAQRLRRRKERQEEEGTPSIEAAFAGAAASRATPNTLHIVVSLPQIDALPPTANLEEVLDEEFSDTE
jgi:hypothetical protein